MFQLRLRSSKKNPNSNEIGHPRVLLLSKEQHLCDSLKEHLATLSEALSLNISSDLSNLEPIDRSLSRCDIIIVDGALERSVLNAAHKALAAMPDYHIVVGVYTDESSKRVFYEWPSLCHLSGAFDVGNGWSEPWKSILELRNAWHRPIMVSRIEDVSVSDVLQMIADGQWTSQVNMCGSAEFNRNGRVQTKARVRGCIAFEKGVPINAWSSESVGVQAIDDFLSLKSGELVVVRPPKMPSHQNVNRTIQEIIFRYAIAQDERIDDQNRVFPKESLENNNEIDFFEKKKGTEFKKKHEQPVELEDVLSIGEESEDDLVDISLVSITKQVKLGKWWADLPVREVSRMLTVGKEDLFPLRWMNQLELRSLIQNRRQSCCFVVKANKEFLEIVLSGYGRDFDPNRPIGPTVPVIRIGRYNGKGFYIVCVTHEINIESLSKHPCVIWLDTDDSENELKKAKAGDHPVSIVFSTDTQRVNRIIKAISKGKTNVYAVVETPNPTWKNISAGFGKIVELFSKISSGST